MADFSRDDVMDNPFVKEQKDETVKLYGLPVYLLFLRILSIFVLLIGVGLWARLIGLNGPHLVDMFLVDNHTAIVDGILAIVLPALGVGLWLGASWGFFLWGLASAGLLITHFIIEPVRFTQYALGASLTLVLIIYLSSAFLTALAKREWGRERN